MLSVFLLLCAMVVAAACLCRRYNLMIAKSLIQYMNVRFPFNRHIRNTQFVRPNNHYLPSTVIHANPPQWNQHQMGTTTAYPYNTYPNTVYPNAVNTPLYNQYQVGPGMGHTIHASHQPTAPGMGYGPPTHYAQQ